jgi:hypothetical protein
VALPILAVSVARPFCGKLRRCDLFDARAVANSRWDNLLSPFYERLMIADPDFW